MVKTWHGGKILPGGEFDREICHHLESADIVLLLISSEFVASDYCWCKEMKRALERHEAGEASVIPVILRPCDWQAAPFGKLQALPKGGKPVAGGTWPSIDLALQDVARGIRRAIEERAKRES